MTDLNETPKAEAQAGDLDGDQVHAVATSRRRAGRPSRHAVIMRGVVTPIVGLLAVAAAILGWLNATLWKPSTQIIAQARVADTRYLVTDPGVLSLVDQSVTLKVTVPGAGSGRDQQNNAQSDQQNGQVCVALGNAKDATGWLQGDSYVRLTGMSDWTSLTAQRASAQGKAAAADAQVPFAESDMWRSVQCGATSATLQLKRSSAAEVAVIDLGQKTNATVAMHWVRSTVPDFAMPLYFVAGLLAVLAVLCASVFAMPPQKRRKRVIEGTATQEPEEVSVSEAIAGSLNGLTSSVSFAPRTKRRRRHAAGAVPADASLREKEPTQPTIVDPSSRNLVADAAAANTASPGSDATTPDDATSVISTDELQSYFARLAQEMNEESGADSATDTPEGDKR